MSNIIQIKANRYLTNELIQNIHNATKGKTIKGIYFYGDSLINCTVDILLDEPSNRVVNKPSKFKKDASSKYYCVYKKGNYWTYKFVNKQLSNKAFYGASYTTEHAAALAYDKHRFSVEGDLNKLNFPEYFEGV